DVIQKFLERIIITDDREQAYSLISKAGYGYKVVTKAGEVFDSNGSIYAGKVAKIAILSRSREKREITEEIGGLEADCVQFDEQVNSFDEKIKKLRTDLNTATDTLRKLEIEHGDISKRYQQATLNHEQAVRKFDWQREQLQISVNRKTDLVQEMSSLRLEIEKQDGDIAGFNKELKKLNIDLLNLPINELREKVNHWKTTEAVASRGFKEIELRYQEVDLSQQKNLETHKIIDRRIQELLAQQEKLEMEKKEILNTLTGLNLEIEALGKQIEPAESALRNYELEYASLQQTQSSAQQVNTVAERYYNQAQLDMMRQRESLENLRKKIEDDFGLVAFEYATDVSGPNPLPIEGMVEMLPELAEIPQDLEDNIARQRALLRRIGPVNLEAQTEYQDVKERFDFLTAQISDLRKAETDLRQVIFELDELMRKEFKKTFNAVAAEFKVFFTRLFGGGSARLILTDEENPTETGIDIEARLPGRREQGLSLLSGGERSLTAVALVFSLLKVSPTPFCVLDEVDAMLDEANVGRFCDLLKELSATTQFIVITHNRNTVQAADVIYGVTMGRDSASQMISLKLDEVSEDMVR
ncbi:MAG: hypothetical protein HGA53_01660, partial [Anaerolineaceae bacterium]|nr:hypothetical protein [Anaerolineaceae bacterium]